MTDPAIANGKSLLEWDGSLSNYALSYLFSQYLRTQIDQAAGTGKGVLSYKAIIEDANGDYKAVEKVIQSTFGSELSFGQFMTNFRAAMLVKAPKGSYGFNGETGFNAISTPLYTGGAIELKGGSAVVKSITAPFTPGVHDGDITYLGIYN